MHYYYVTKLGYITNYIISLSLARFNYYQKDTLRKDSLSKKVSEKKTEKISAFRKIVVGITVGGRVRAVAAGIIINLTCGVGVRVMDRGRDGTAAVQQIHLSLAGSLHRGEILLGRPALEAVRAEAGPRTCQVVVVILVGSGGGAPRSSSRHGEAAAAAEVVIVHDANLGALKSKMIQRLLLI